MSDVAAWFLSRAERDNPDTAVDDAARDDRAWTEGNEVTPLVDGAAYFAVLHETLEATGRGDLVFFTDWQGDAGERLTDEPGSEVVEVLGRARARGVDVRGLVWRSHTDQAGFFARSNRHLGERLHRRGVPTLLDMRVRPLGSHHQKLVVVRHAERPERDVAFLGGIDLARNRRDTSAHEGDPQGRRLTPEYGPHAPWHDVQVALRGPVVHAAETTFRERWDDPAPLSLAPWRRVADRVRPVDTEARRLPPQRPAPPPAGDLPVQLLRTYPDLGPGRAYPFARRGEYSVAAGYEKAIARAERLIYVEDQYFWGDRVADAFERQLRRNPELRLVVLLPLHPDVGGVNRHAQHLGREQALGRLARVAPGRVAAFGLENAAGTPVYVHAKVCVVDDTWVTTGSDNFCRRSWTHDSELTAAVVDRDYATALRLRLAAEHLGCDAADVDSGGDSGSDRIDPAAFVDQLTRHARALDDWHTGGRVGDRPPGHLRTLPAPRVPRWWRRPAGVLLDRVHDPGGGPSRRAREAAPGGG